MLLFLYDHILCILCAHYFDRKQSRLWERRRKRGQKTHSRCMACGVKSPDVHMGPSQKLTSVDWKGGCKKSVPSWSRGAENGVERTLQRKCNGRGKLLSEARLPAYLPIVSHDWILVSRGLGAGGEGCFFGRSGTFLVSIIIIWTCSINPWHTVN